MILRSLLAVCLLCGILGQAIAAPGGAAPRDQRIGNSEDAEKHYKAGLRHRDAAWVYEEKIAGLKNEKERATYAQFVQRTYKRALAEFQKATELDPKFHQAFSSLGYVRRKTGDMEGALAAYGRALELNPNYTEAIEYRAEAHLELGRFEDVQAAFDILAVLNKPHAARLLQFAGQWASKQNDADLKTTVLGWVAEKKAALGEIEPVEKW